MVDDTATLRRYTPLEAAGLALTSASIRAGNVLLQRFDGEGGTTHGGVDQAGLVGTVLNLTSLGILDGGGDVHGHGADLRVRHQATGAEDLTQGTDDTHGVGSGDTQIEIDRCHP
jgi:hypothetical protein